jgi:hypothetical protein
LDVVDGDLVVAVEVIRSFTVLTQPLVTRLYPEQLARRGVLLAIVLASNTQRARFVDSTQRGILATGADPGLVVVAPDPGCSGTPIGLTHSRLGGACLCACSADPPVSLRVPVEVRIHVWRDWGKRMPRAAHSMSDRACSWLCTSLWGTS